MSTANIIAWLVIGAIVGLLFVLARQPKNGTLTLIDVIVGVVGGLIGGILLNAVGGIVGAEIIGVNIGAGVVAIVGAIILVFVAELLTRSSQQ